MGKVAGKFPTGAAVWRFRFLLRTFFFGAFAMNVLPAVSGNLGTTHFSADDAEYLEILPVEKAFWPLQVAS
jgi:hypothetical protein